MPKAALRRSGARLLIASYTHSSHTIASASTHQRVRVAEGWCASIEGIAAVDPPGSIETAVLKRDLMLPTANDVSPWRYTTV